MPRSNTTHSVVASFWSTDARCPACKHELTVVHLLDQYAALCERCSIITDFHSSAAEAISVVLRASEIAVEDVLEMITRIEGEQKELN